VAVCHRDLPRLWHVKCDFSPACEASFLTVLLYPQGMAQKGRVVLLGVGPGGPGLISLAALDVLQTADVVLYDRLAGPAFRRFVRPTTELVDVGKRPGRTDVTQDQISQRLVAEALAGRTVVRVKGGDPLIFGRGFEEAVMCTAAGVPVQIVPGISSALAAPAVAGVPLTHRGLPPMLTILSGHEVATKERPALDWAHIADTPGPIVLLMSVRNFQLLTQRLLAAGRSPDTPVAAVEWATTPQQRCLRSRLGVAATEFAAAGLSSPAVLVIGENVAFQDEAPDLVPAPEVADPAGVSRGLLGWNVLVPRSRLGPSTLAMLLRAEGAHVLEVPVLAFCGPENTQGLTSFGEALDAGAVDLVACSSGNRADWLLQGLVSVGRDVRSLAGVRLLATQTDAVRALHRASLLPETVSSGTLPVAPLPAPRAPLGFSREAEKVGGQAKSRDGMTSSASGVLSFGEDTQDTENELYLLREEPRHTSRNRAVVPAVAGASESLLDELARVGWNVERLDVVCATRLSVPSDLQAKAMGADAVVFASSGTAAAYAASGLPVPPVVVCIGPRTKDAAEAASLQVNAVPHQHDLEGAVDALLSHAARRAVTREYFFEDP